MSTPVGPYTPVVPAGPFVVTSGQIGIADGAVVAGGLEAELRQAMANLAAVLESGGARMDQVVKTTVFMTSMADYALMNSVYTELFGDHRPARSAVAVKELPLGALIEIEALAYVG
ncbi:MAG: Rid family detoxifying hydrolase [Acidimicrobiales bacterium]